MRLQTKLSKDQSKPTESHPKETQTNESHHEGPRLCDACRFVFSSWEENWSDQRPPNHFSERYLTFKELVASSASCQMCSILLRRGYEPEPEEGESPWDQSFAHIKQIEPGSFAMEIRKPLMLPSQRIQFARTLFGQIVQSNQLPTSLENHTNSNTSWKLCENWLDRCERTHKQCKTDRQEYRLPTRLIDLGTRWKKPHLCLCNELPRQTRYATLSHCWGKMPIARLERGNFQEFKKALPLWKLTRTFTDAFDTARRFSLRYIWIDSLCIIQDDRSDWATESLMMCDVYGFSALNIAATGAEDGRKGLFFSRDPLAVQKFQTTIRPRSSTALPIKIDWGLGRAHHYCVILTPLGSRGWVFQERFLSPKTLHFGKEQIFWDCVELQACETYPEGLSPLNYRQNDSTTHRDISERRNLPTRDEAWGSAVEDYTSRELTKIEDNLVAISGVAKWMHKTYGGTYLCGFWKESLPHSLLWANDWANQLSNIYIAPSWSWASTIDDIRFARPRESPDPLLVSLIDTQVRTLGSSIYGQLISGVLRLKCCSLVQCDEEVIEKEWIWHYLDRTGKKLMSWVPPNCYYLSFYDRGNKMDLDGLIVQPTRRARGQYCRMGIYILQKNGNTWLQSARAASNSLKDGPTYEEICEVENDAQRYIISLV